MKKSFMSLVMLLVTIWTLSGCAANEPPPVDDPPTEAEEAYNLGDESPALQRFWLGLNDYQYYVQASLDQDDFMFYDGTLGTRLIMPNEVVWVNRGVAASYWFGEGNFDSFTDNEDILTDMARLLTP